MAAIWRDTVIVSRTFLLNLLTLNPLAESKISSAPIHLHLEAIGGLQISADSYAICWQAERLATEKPPLYRLRIYENDGTTLIKTEFTKSTCRLLRKLPKNEKCCRIEISEFFETEEIMEKIPEETTSSPETTNEPKTTKNDKNLQSKLKKDQLFMDITLRPVEG